MNRIIVLQPHIANQIAAGEVVERPASIVKELVENAIDAGASAITIEIKNGGMDYIRVTDNGSGIPAADCLLAFERHATSKISHAEDLTHIETLGFRGEALASIAAVAQVRLKTRAQGEDAGSLVCIEGGACKAHEPIGCPEGTTLEVLNIFYNVPARRKFLKAARTEGGYVGEYLTRMILARPDISFKFLANEKVIYQSPGDGVLKDAIYCVYGGEVLPHLKPIFHDDGYLQITGFVGTEQIARPNRAHQSFLVNGRYIRSNLLSSSIQCAFDTRLMSGRYPFAVISLRIASNEVDVNVHPNKLEVRFTDESRVSRALTNATKAALGSAVAPTMQWPKDTLKANAPFSIVLEQQEGLTAPKADGKIKFQPSRPIGREDVPSFRLSPTICPALESYKLKEADGFVPVDPKPLQQADGAPDIAKEPAVPTFSISSEVSSHEKRISSVLQPEQQAFGITPFSVAGKVFDTYWIVQQGEHIFFIDQHAAHERALYNRFMESQSTPAQQMLLTPEMVTLTPAEQAALEQYEPIIRSLGFSIEPFGPLTIRVTAVPSILQDCLLTGLVHTILDKLLKQGKANTQELLRENMIQASCKHAVKAGDPLTKEEIAALLEDYAREGAPMTCPHGRPVMIQMTRRELEKLFKRIL